MQFHQVHPSDVGQRWTIRGKPSFDIEYISINGRECFRVRHHTYFIGYCYTLPELERLLELRDLSLADLVEIDGTEG